MVTDGSASSMRAEAYLQWGGWLIHGHTAQPLQSSLRLP